MLNNCESLADVWQSCAICPRHCRADRAHGQYGVCGAGTLPKVAKACLHHWEEPCISGSRGSGAVFFSHCNLRCVFCQNWRISHEGYGSEVSVARLAEIFRELEAAGAHNVNLVSPTPYLPAVAEAITLARREGLAVPVVYNTNAYEKPEALSLLDGLVDIYLPDLKYASPDAARSYSGAADYFEQATSAILEMHRQVGDVVLDENGMMRRGMIIRHLVLPGQVEGGQRVAEWIRDNLPDGVMISLMAQYTPVYRAGEFPELTRTVTPAEYDEVVDYFLDLGLDNGFIQELDSVGTHFTPNFNLEGVEKPAKLR